MNLIVADNFRLAGEVAHKLGLRHGQWKYVSGVHQAQGVRNATVWMYMERVGGWGREQVEAVRYLRMNGNTMRDVYSL